MTRRQLTWLGAVVLVGAAAPLVLLAPWRGLDPGPMGADPGAPNRIAFAVEAGTPFSYGLVVLRNPGLVAAEVTGVELVGAAPELVLVEATVRSLRDVPDHGLIANDASYPPAVLAGHLAPAVGARIPASSSPADAMELVLALRVDVPGTRGFTAVAVRYELGGDAYRAVFPNALVVCAPGPDEACDMAE